MLKSGRIKPFLWFDTEAEEAATFYTSVFRSSRIGAVRRFPEGSHRPAGLAMTVEFELEGQAFVALNGGPEFKFTEAVSFAVECADQAEIDYYWQKLTEGGTPVQCGWLKDRFGLSWQVVPANLGRLFEGKDPKKAERVMRMLLKMVKLDIAALEAAGR